MQSSIKSSNADNRQKHVNCTAIQGILIYFRRQYGQEALIQFLDEINLPYSQLSDRSEWISFDEYKCLIKAFVDYTGNPDTVLEIGKYSCSREALGWMWAIFLADFVGLQSTIKKVVENANLFNRASNWQIIKLNHNKFHLRINWKDGNQPSHHLCHYRQGLFSYLPSIWNGEPAKHIELKCKAKGDDYCEEIYTWKSRARYTFSLVFPLVAGTGIAAYSSIFNEFSLLFTLYIAIAFLIGKIFDDKILNQNREYYNHQQQTELRRTIGELEKKQDELSATNKMANRAYEELFEGKKIESIKTIAAGTAHNLNNLLVGISGYVDMARYTLERKERENPAIEYLREADKALKSSGKLINQFFNFSRTGTPITKSITINECLRESVAFSLMGSNVECIYDIDDKLSPINADKYQISQVIGNLVINAKHAMPQGGHLYVSAKNIYVSPNSPAIDPKVKNGSYVLISIRDEGCGIPKKQLKVIFEPYFTTKKHGKGLGLASSISIIKKYKGYMIAQSEEGKGSSFSIYLPISESDITDNAKIENFPIFSRGRILILDDDVTIQKVLEGMLTYLGYEVTVAQNGNQAITFYIEAMKKDNPYDVVIIDLILPGTIGGGNTVMKSLIGIDPHTRGIATSSYNDDSLHHYIENGFSNAIRKPYNLSHLSLVIFDAIYNFQENQSQDDLTSPQNTTPHN